MTVFRQIAYEQPTLSGSPNWGSGKGPLPPGTETDFRSDPEGSWNDTKFTSHRSRSPAGQLAKTPINELDPNTNLGTLGELMVQLELLQYRVQAAPPLKDSGNDLIAVRDHEFRAVQVKTTATNTFDLRHLPGRCHLVALVKICRNDREEVSLDQTRVFLVPYEEVARRRYKIDHFSGSELSAETVDHLFGP